MSSKLCQSGLDDAERTGQQQWDVAVEGHVTAFSPLASGRARKMPGKRQGHGARHSAG